MTTIVVIEDEDQTRDIFLRCLEFEGFRALGAGNGTLGLELTRCHQPDLVVCDIMMPDMDGHTVLTTMRRCRETAAIPLIFLTAKVTMSDLRCGMDLGADDYLTKPCSIDQFLAAIHTRLRRKVELSHPCVPATAPDSLPATPTMDLLGAIAYPDHPKLAPVFQFIEVHYRQPITLTQVAQSIGYAPAYLTSLVQQKTGKTVKQWIVERRMAQARDLLHKTSQSVQQVAELSGYADAGHFTRQFRRFHGIPPQNWRKKSAP